jgi:hypothetical protein
MGFGLVPNIIREMETGWRRGMMSGVHPLEGNKRKEEGAAGFCWAALAGPRGQPSWAACPFFLFFYFSFSCFTISLIIFAIELQMNSNQLLKFSKIHSNILYQ